MISVALASKYKKVTFRHGLQISLTFSSEKLTDCDAHLEWYPAPADNTAPLPGGNWYKAIIGEQSLVCWLCPALFRYFDAAPQDIFVRIEQC
jgi:hypothetical protein